jgi:hypothetical protein
VVGNFDSVDGNVDIKWTVFMIQSSKKSQFHGFHLNGITHIMELISTVRLINRE